MTHKFILILITSFFFTLNVHAQTKKCPRGIMYECPGLCGWYVDENNDGFCDYSIVEKEVVIDPIVNTTDSTQQQNSQEQNKQTEVNNNSDDTLIKDTVIVDNKEANNKTTTTKTSTKKNLRPRYPLIFISLITLIPYFITTLLVKAKIMKKRIHRKIWNYILLITFTVAGILGLLLVIQINYKIMMNLFLENLKLHVEFGISMAIISIIHVIWHWKYYFSIKKQKD